MYTDDLILISHASRKTAHNIKLCLSIYEHLTNQKDNVSKFEIFFFSKIGITKKLSEASVTFSASKLVLFLLIISAFDFL